MTERLDESAAEPKRGFWDELLDGKDDDAELTMTITDMDGSNPRGGTIRVGDVRETFADPGYQAMMRRAQEHLKELRALGEPPIPDTIPQNPQS